MAVFGGRVEIKQRQQVVVGQDDTGQLHMLNTDERGRLKLATADINVALDGSTPTGDSVFLYGFDGANNVKILVNADGRLQIDVINIPNLDNASDTVAVYGFDGTNNQALSVDTEGHLQVDILTQPNLDASADTVAIYGTGGQVNTDAEGDVQVDVKTVPPQREVLGYSATALGANATYSTGVIDVLNYTTISFHLSADVDSATDGVQVIGYHNATGTAYPLLSLSYTGGTEFTPQIIDITAFRYVEVKYINGATAQTNFEIGIYAIK